MLEARMKRVTIHGIEDYASPLLWIHNAPKLKALMDATIPNLRSTQRRLLKDLEKTAVHNAEC